MKNIAISDITLKRYSEAGAAALSFNEKIETVKRLDMLNADVIETAPVLNGKTDILFLHTAAALMKSSVLSCPTALLEESVEEVCEAIKEAKKPRVLIPVPVSTVQMEYICGKKPAKMLALIETLVKKAVSLCDEVEVSMLDATRAETDFLCSVIDTAVGCGAKIINICDDAGTMLPWELNAYIKELYEKSAELKNAVLSFECSDKLHMAAADMAAAADAGAEQIKVSVSPSVEPSLKTFADFIRAKGDSLGMKTSVDLTRVEKTVEALGFLADNAHDAATPFDGGTGAAVSDEAVLGENDDIKTVSDVIAHMGYELTDEDIKTVYDEFKKTAAKKNVGTKELDSIIASCAMQVPSTYKLKSYVINSGDIIAPTANIEVFKGEEIMRGLCIGDGPIDAAFLALEQITGHHYELDDFRIKSVTRGYEAMGSALVKLRHNGKLFSGSGTSTDIVGASISAYINALNKICFEEGIR